MHRVELEDFFGEVPDFGVFIKLFAVGVVRRPGPRLKDDARQDHERLGDLGIPFEGISDCGIELCRFFGLGGPQAKRGDEILLGAACVFTQHHGALDCPIRFGPEDSAGVPRLGQGEIETGVSDGAGRVELDGVAKRPHRFVEPEAVDEGETLPDEHLRRVVR